jgi:maltose O-acetyltransferase
MRRAVRGDLDGERLRQAGVRLDGKVLIERDVWVDLEWGWLISIGDRVTLSPGVMVFAHDAATRRGLGHTRVAPVTIGARSYIGAGSIVLPGVTIGEDAIVGAGSVVARDVPAGSLAAGCPARVLSSADEFLARREAQVQSGLVVDDVARRRRAPEWGAERVELAERIRAAGEAWVT